MERSVRVNALPENDDAAPVIDIPIHPVPATVAAKADMGPCLYFGPEGQRCNERAFDDGFCAKHQPGASAPISSSSKVVIASMGIIGLLWPYFADLFREIIRLVSSR